jgi:zinc transport system permease protein
MFTEPYVLRALAAALILGPLGALLGVWVTARRLAFFSDTVAHAALAGVAVGLWSGMTDPFPVMLGVSLVVALVLLRLRERTELLTDSILALLLSAAVAFAVVVFSRLKGYRGDLERYLFGDILSVGPSDLAWAAAAALAVAVGVTSGFRALTLTALSEDLAHVSGVRIRRLNLFFLLGLTVAVTLTIRLAGVLLATAMLVVPAATARNLARSFRTQVTWSLAAGAGAALAGVAASAAFDWPPGPSIVLAGVALFALSVPAARRSSGRRTTVPEGGPA